MAATTFLGEVEPRTTIVRLLVRSCSLVLGVFAIVATLGVCHEALAERRAPAVCLPCPTPKPCCDDYCSKLMPCTPCPQNNYVCDDYCRKCIPCAPCPNAHYVCDDYCGKPTVCIAPLCSPWMKCNAPCATGACAPPATTAARPAPVALPYSYR